MTHTVSAVADSLGVSRRTVRQWIDSGELSAVNLSASRSSQRPRLRIREADLQAFLDARSVGRSAQQTSRARRYRPAKKYV